MTHTNTATISSTAVLSSPDDLVALIETADAETLQALTRLLDAEDLAKSPASFAQRISQGTAEPWIPYRWLRYLDQKVMDVIEGRSDKHRLMVFAPPRHGKSEYCSKYLPSWFLTRFPERRVILTAYESDFARDWGRKVRNLIEANRDLLPIRIERTSSAADRWNLEGHMGGMITAGAGGSITGRGAHLFIIDDPIKNAVDAYSSVVRNGVWDWWQTTAFTRIEPGGVFLLIQTRWHEDDLAGRLLDENADYWDVVDLAAMAEEEDPLGREVGEALCPERFPLEGHTGLIEKKATMGVSEWSAQYQQRPQPEGGGRFRKSTFKYWVNDDLGYKLREEDGPLLINKDECWHFATVDFAITEKTSGDFTVACVWAVAPQPEPSKLILLHRLRARVVGPDHLPMLEKLWADFPQMSFIGVERASFGIGVIQAAIRRGLPIRELIPDKDKWARSEQAAVMCENGRVYFPANVPWLAEWEQELLGFPASTHDDQVDAFSYGALEVFRGMNLLRRKKKPEPQTFDEKAWAMLEKRGKQSSDHPILGHL